jgi:uncharacterized repeat protein (TIGR03803 family)
MNLNSFTLRQTCATVFLLLTMTCEYSLPAQTERVIHNFAWEPDGAGPTTGLVMDSAGNLYGTTSYGGFNCALSVSGCGTIFRVNTSGEEIVLYAFSGGSDGSSPSSSLVLDSQGNLYGTAFSGGDLTCNTEDEGCGTAFKLDTNGNFTVLHTFTGNPDGKYPWGPLIIDSSGNLYGTTYEGGTVGCGTIFKITTSGTEKILHNFICGRRGYAPRGGLVRDSKGNLYGTATKGGAFGNGIVFRLTNSGQFTVLHNFDGADGDDPQVGLVGDSAGNGYGTTYDGGVYGFGTVFKLDSKANFSVLYSFGGIPDGAYPLDPLILDRKRNLYGTTSGGGSGQCGGGCGIVFELDSSGRETILHNFGGEPDGALPWGGLVLDTTGNLYGTTFYGGDSGDICGAGYGCGTVFEITP